MKELKPRRLISISQIKETLKSFTSSEKLFFSIFLLIFLIGVLGLLIKINNQTLVEVPRRGGSITEGIVGSPRFINPLLAQKDVDQDLTMLIYSGLLRLDRDGNLVNDLAGSYEVNIDGTIYTVKLKDGLTFHDGTPITADDVIFTTSLAQSTSAKNTVQSAWNNVLVEKVDDLTITFTISEAYVPFKYNLTLGILPEHLWEEVPMDDFLFSELNTRPIGSGPYRIGEVKENNGVPTKYILQSFDNFALGKPYIDTINIDIYKDRESLEKANKGNEVTNAYGVIPNNNQTSISGTLPRTFAVYFNQNQANIFAKKSIREALSAAIDRDMLIEEILGGNGEALRNPIPSSLSNIPSLTRPEDSIHDEGIIESKESFEDIGYEYNNETGLLENEDGENITFTLSTSDSPQLVAVGEYLVDKWREVGINVELKIYDQTNLTQRAIRPREYEALLFGQVLPHGLDLYSFWHSSQRNDPGLNVALYTNLDVDKAVSSLRKEEDESARSQLYNMFLREMRNDIPAVFLFSPKYVYSYPEEMTVKIPSFITNPSERFSMIHTWYRETDSVWPFIKR